MISKIFDDDQWRAVTLAHVYAAARWAATGEDGAGLEGLVYDQLEWGGLKHGEPLEPTCGTACCLWGGACALATNSLPTEGPPEEWAQQSDLHFQVAVLFADPYTKPQNIFEAFHQHGYIVNAAGEVFYHDGSQCHV